MPEAPDAATIAVWSERQIELAKQLRVPATELYYVSHPPALSHECTHGASSPSVQPFLGAVDPEFVHADFELPEAQLVPIIEALRGGGGSGAGTSDGLASPEASSKAIKSAVAAQLEHDLEAQKNSLGTRDAMRESGQGEAATAAVPSSCGVLRPLRFVGGLDISFIPNTSLGVACLAIFTYPELTPVKTLMHHCVLTEPYISGFLAFREVQPVLGLFSTYKTFLDEEGCRPQLLFVDGCGVHHPRRCGLASHLGVLLGMPTIGCAKKMLVVDGVGREDIEACFATPSLPDEQAEGGRSVHSKGAAKLEQGRPKPSSGELWIPPMHPILGKSVLPSSPSAPTEPHPLQRRVQHRMYGYALLTTGNSSKKCIFVSPGNKIGFAMAAALVISVCRSRIPEPIRGADLSSRQYIREGKYKS